MLCANNTVLAAEEQAQGPCANVTVLAAEQQAWGLCDLCLCICIF